MKKPSARLTHFDAAGKARMVDTGQKTTTQRQATAKGYVSMSEEALTLIKKGQASKGDVLGVARLAGIMAAKKTSDLIPLCHPIGLNSVTIDFALGKKGVEITATCSIAAQTGVEMEALTAVSVSALTIYDMMKAVDKSMRISDIRLTYKSGGKSGTYRAG